MLNLTSVQLWSLAWIHGVLTYQDQHSVLIYFPLDLLGKTVVPCIDITRWACTSQEYSDLILGWKDGLRVDCMPKVMQRGRAGIVYVDFQLYVQTGNCQISCGKAARICSNQ